MAAALIHFDPKQKRLLTCRAKQRGRSFSQEVRNAVDLYLSVPVEIEEGLSVFGKSRERGGRPYDQTARRTIAHVDRTLKQYRKVHNELGR
jgi:hypothetical protein